MKFCRLLMALWLLTVLLVAALCRSIDRQNTQIGRLKVDLAIAQTDVIIANKFNAKMSEGIQYLVRENQILGAELAQRPTREYRHY